VTAREPLPELLKGSEASAMLRINDKTLVRWARAGRSGRVRLPSGHYRYYAAEIEALVRSGQR